MNTIVVMPGGFHPFHAGHYALYQSAIKAFPEADVYVAASNDTSERPFPFSIKEKLAKVAGVKPKQFVQVSSPFRPQEITSKYNPDSDVLIFVRSDKDKNEQPKPGGTKKDGTPAYYQPYTGKDLQPFSKHAYMAYLPTVEFGPGITSASEIRAMWPKLNDKRKTALVMSLYPKTLSNTKLAQNVVKLLDAGMGVETVNEKMKMGATIEPIEEDAELVNALAYAQQHYPGLSNKQQAFLKFVQRSLKHSKEDDIHQDQEIDDLYSDIEKLKQRIDQSEPLAEQESIVMARVTKDLTGLGSQIAKLRAARDQERMKKREQDYGNPEAPKFDYLDEK